MVSPVHKESDWFGRRFAVETMNTETSMKTISGRISEYAAALSFRDVSESVVAYAKMLMLGLLGAALSGVDTAEGQFGDHRDPDTAHSSVPSHSTVFLSAF